MAEWLATLPYNFDEPKVLERMLVMLNQLFDTVLDGMRDARQIFRPEQIDEFPTFFRASFDIKSTEVGATHGRLRPELVGDRTWAPPDWTTSAPEHFRPTSEPETTVIDLGALVTSSDAPDK